MGNMRRTDHDFGRHAADIDASAANDGAAFNHRYFGAFFHCFQGASESARTTADDRHMERLAMGCRRCFFIGFGRFVVDLFNLITFLRYLLNQ